MQLIDINSDSNEEYFNKLGKSFEDKEAFEILDFSLRELNRYGELVFLTAFGPEGCVLLDLIAKTVSKPHNFIVANLDTGYQFKESLELKERLEEKYQIPIELIKPDLSPEIKAINNLYETDPDQCCYLRKIKPLHKLLTSRLAWITSIRRDQTEVRSKAMAFEYDYKFKLGKINPLFKWSKSDIWKYIHENEVPYNPLLDQGYDSIGCEPCTKPGSDRQGRWAGKDKIECGLHIQDDETGGEFMI